ncbi:MAG: hypothetical protein ABI794_09915 [Betaproteobacteria bacterium]
MKVLAFVLGLTIAGSVPARTLQPSNAVDPGIATKIARINLTEHDAQTWDYASNTLEQPWARGRKGSNWIDADGVAEGSKPFASLPILTGPAPGYLAIAVPPKLVIRLLADNTGILVGGRGAASEPKFATLNDPSAEHKPLLSVTTDKGTFECPIMFDSWTSVTSNHSLADLTYFSPPHASLRFDLSAVRGAVRSATLRLYLVGWYSPYTLDIYYFDVPELLTDPRSQHSEKVEPGLTDVAGEDGLKNNPQVLVYMDVNGKSSVDGVFQQGWTPDDMTFTDIPEYGLRGFECHNDNKNSTCVNSRNLFLDKPSRNPQPYQTKVGKGYDRLFVSYLIRIPDGHCAWQGTKIPGAEGILGVRSGGYAYKDWTASELFDDDLGFGFSMEHGIPSVANGSAQALLVYMYDQDRKLSSPDRGRIWTTSSALLPGRWYHIEFEMKLNSLKSRPRGPGNDDGEFRVWLDGVLVYENTHWRARGHANAQILSAVMLIMHGGNGLPLCKQTYGISRWIVSKVRVGPPRRLQ